MNNTNYTVESLSIAQQSLWLIHSCSSDKSIYNCQWVWDLPESTDIEILKAALQRLVDHHPILRARFVEEEGRVVQRIYDEAELVFNSTHIEDISDEDFLETVINKEFKTPFDLENDLSMRWNLYTRPNRTRVLTVNIHHIVGDLSSIMTFFNELRASYESELDGQPLKLETPKLNYVDFIKTQNSFISSEKGKEEEAYWLNELQDAETSLNLPLDKKRPSQINCSTSYFNKFIPSDVANKFNQFVDDQGFSLFGSYLSVYHLLLYKYTNQQNILVGTPTAGRGGSFAGVFGYFTNPIIIQSRIEDSIVVGDYLTQMNEKILSGIRVQNFPLSKVSEKLDIERDTSRSSLFQTSFVWQNINSFQNRDNPLVSWNHDGQRFWDLGSAGVWERWSRRQQLDDQDITFKIYKFKKDFFIGIEYNSDLFFPETIERMAEHYQKLLLEVVANADQKISQVSLVTEKERALVQNEWNATEVPYPNDKFLHNFVDEWADNEPELVALRSATETMTYAELSLRSNLLANHLISIGIKQESIVGVAIDRNFDTIISILAIHKAGGAYLPLDPEYPGERLAFMVEDASVSTIITHSGLKDRLSLDAENTICLDKDWATISTGSSENPNLSQSGNQLSYVIYTSGSTGKPKGVLVEQSQLSHHLTTLREVFDITEQDRVLQFATLNFDASVMTYCLALQSGASLYLAPKETLLGEGLFETIRNQSLSCVMVPPSVLAALKPESFASLRYLMVAGEPVSSDLAYKWAQVGHRLTNVYGPTECTVWATTALLDGERASPIGKALANTKLHILDANMKHVPIGVPGELYISGSGVTRGYLNRPELTEAAFLPNPFSNEEGSRLYKTGDLARYRNDGNVECLGRIDHQIKIRGFRVELGEIEASILEHELVDNVLVMARNDMTGKGKSEPLLAAYVITQDKALSVEDLKIFLKQKLPDYMIPSGIVFLDAFPLTPNEKIDRKALPVPELGGSSSSSRQTPRNELEKTIAAIWQKVLNVQDVSTDENFFDMGGHSLLLAEVYTQFPKSLKNKLSMVDLFKFPTIRSLAKHLEQDDTEEDQFYLEQDEHIERLRLRRRAMENLRGLKIAIVGMAGRFPGAETVDEFWQNIVDGKESIRFYSDEELLQDGVDQALLGQRDYVKAKGAIKNPKGFDADFFGYTAREAQITDPQHRLFLECAYEALEDGGCVPEKFVGKIGVYAGTGINNYMMNHISANPSVQNTMGDYPVLIGNDKDFLSNRVSYKLNLNGPAMVIQTACSTSLVAVHSACQALINEECDAALAGGVSLGKLDNEGYTYKEGMIMSPDGHCRAFDKDAKGTILGQGAGVVLLKRLDDAMQDNDHIYGVIKGSGINNDGSSKSGYTAPSIEGQAKAIMLAHASADVSPDQITYVEAHGTGTQLGDPIEVEGLNYAFNTSAQALFKTDLLKKQSCALGSVKTNVGHMDAASGVAGLIKATKALETATLPAMLHFNEANPKINFEKTPFYVNTECKPWPKQVGGRHAGVSSFGIGGTNAHVVLSEAPNKTTAGSSRPWQILVLSARTEEALEARTQQLLGFLEQNPELSFSDVCFSLHVGRKLFEHRRYLVCRNANDAILELSKPNIGASSRIETKCDDKVDRQIAFMFTGQGSQYVNMARTLYRVELNFRRVVDHCREILQFKFVYLFERLVEDDFSALSDKVHDTYITQPTLFITEYALAKTLISWGIEPDLMIGHSVGEYVAACLAGVFTLEEALELVTIRGRMIYDLERGDMMTVELSEAEVQKYLGPQVSLAAINGARRCVVSGESDSIIALQKQLNAEGINNRILHTSHAFHSHMMDDILADFTNSVTKRQPRRPHKPFVSTLTGKMITDEQATSSEYWASHLRNAVRFHDGLETLLDQREHDDSGWILLEIGPGKVLSTLARQHPARQTQDFVYETMRQSDENVSDTFKLLSTIAELWINGVDIDWKVFHSSRQRYKIPLPTYPFERLDYWIESGKKLRLTHDRRGVGVSMSLPPLPKEKMLTKAPLNADVEERDEVDRFICRLWEKTLGVKRVSINDNYFDLGGDSLRAVGIIDKLVSQYKAPIATHILIQKPTVALLSDHIRDITLHPEAHNLEAAELKYTSSLVTIQKGSERKQPLFMVHPIGGEVYFYRDLAHQLGSDQPLFAFQATSLTGQTEPYTDVASMAADYISELKVIGAKPPYLLGGSSFGGLVAYEMAQQLKALGEEVRLLVMIDTPFPQEMPAHLTNSAAILDYLLKDKIPLSLERLNKLEPKNQIEYVLAEARMRGKSDLIPPHIGVPLFSTWIAHQEATFAYEPRNYSDDVVFFRHTERMEHFPSAPHETWLDYIEGKVEIHQVPGDHITMNMHPHVNVLASHLKIVLKNTADQIQRDNKQAEANKLYPQNYEIDTV